MNERLKAFCDGVFAIAITLLILDIKVPPLSSIHSSTELLRALTSNWPSWFAFLLSFMSMFIAWVNHNLTIKEVHKTSAIFLYANGLLMFTVIVYPFVTALLAQYLNTPYAQLPVFVYCLFNTIHAGVWVLLYHAALHPINLSRNEVSFKRIIVGRRSIAYTVFFNAAMCVLAFWLLMLAVALTALAWLVYMIMGIVLTPAE